MKILLDIDGVMAPVKSWVLPNILEDGFIEFSKEAVDVLNNIITKDCSILLTSSHKNNYSNDEWKSIFKKRGIDIEIEILETDKNLSRIEEILSWKNENNEEFLIIDDDKSLNDLPKFYKERLILTSSMLGLSMSDFY